MRRIANGDQHAFAVVYERHMSVALRIAQDLCTSQGDDVVQDVFLGLWRHPEAFDPARGALRSYVIMKTRSRAIDVLRSTGARRAREHHVETMHQRLRAWKPTPPFEADHVDVRPLLENLPAPQREAIVLAFFGDCTYRKVAILLGRPEGTVKGALTHSKPPRRGIRCLT